MKQFEYDTFCGSFPAEWTNKQSMNRLCSENGVRLSSGIIRMDQSWASVRRYNYRCYDPASTSTTTTTTTTTLHYSLKAAATITTNSDQTRPNRHLLCTSLYLYPLSRSTYSFSVSGFSPAYITAARPGFRPKHHKLPLSGT